MNLEIVTVILFLVFLLGTASIYLQHQLGAIGSAVGGFFFTLFGMMAYFLPPLIFFIFLSAVTNQLQGRLAKNLAYLFAIFMCVSFIIAIRNSPGGSFQTNLEIAGEKGLLHKGSGMVGAFFAFILQRLIGDIGIYLVSLIVCLFFILHLFDIPLSQFLQAIWNGGKALFGFGKDKILGSFQSSREAIRRRRENRKEREEGDLAKTEKEFPSSASLSSLSGSPETVIPTDRELDRSGDEEIKIKINNYAEDFDRDHRSATADEPPKTKLRRLLPDRIEDLPDGQEMTLEEKHLQREPQPPKGRVALKADEGEQVSMENLGFPVAEEVIEYIRPPVELLKKQTRSAAVNENELKKQAEIIEKTLASFDIEVRVVSIQRGPTVTQFELKPVPGIKVSRITNLSDDLALTLATPEIRIEAPIPGKPYIGIEVPNKEKEAVLYREILQSGEFMEADDAIPVALGQSISGKPIIANIAKMPHLLVAGATGSGKSVCINTIIMSMIYKYAPSEVRMILVDPKVVELSVYNGIPHLLIPVVTDPKKASRALYMAVQEMERRYKLFSQHSVRDIKGYREKQQIDDSMEGLPYIVVIIDELSDLMMVAAKDVEAHITRLAQMARACGIHLIIATQRPSVDVITGTIKANIPSRISFQVSSAIDSRTILDMSGAEKLLGKGDMLYYPSNLSKPLRVQGAFISDNEVANIVDFLKEKHDASYDKELMQSIETSSSSSASGDPRDDHDDLIEEVLEFISHEETTSISALQRRFRIGYARAGRIMDDLETMRAVSAQDGAKPRDVLITAADLEGEEDESAE